MKVKCDNCGKIFDSDEIKVISEYMGEFWGMPAYEDFEACPYCDSYEIDNVKENEEDD